MDFALSKLDSKIILTLLQTSLYSLVKDCQPTCAFESSERREDVFPDSDAINTDHHAPVIRIRMAPH